MFRAFRILSFLFLLFFARVIILLEIAWYLAIVFVFACYWSVSGGCLFGWQHVVHCLVDVIFDEVFRLSVLQLVHLGSTWNYFLRLRCWHPLLAAGRIHNLLTCWLSCPILGRTRPILNRTRSISPSIDRSFARRRFGWLWLRSVWLFLIILNDHWLWLLEVVYWFNRMFGLRYPSVRNSWAWTLPRRQSTTRHRWLLLTHIIHFYSTRTRLWSCRWHRRMLSGALAASATIVLLLHSHFHLFSFCHFALGTGILIIIVVREGRCPSTFQRIGDFGLDWLESAHFKRLRIVLLGLFTSRLDFLLLLLHFLNVIALEVLSWRLSFFCTSENTAHSRGIIVCSLSHLVLLERIWWKQNLFATFVSSCLKIYINA